MTAATNPFGLTRAYARSSYASSLWQLCNTLLLYGVAIALMFASVDVHYAITLLLSLVASVAYLRLFMIGHDCSHESFMPLDWQNRLIGNLMGVLTNTPFRYWARQHALHHRGNGNLGIALYYGVLIAALGWKAFLLVYVPVVYLSSLFSAWLFYVQHQFPGAYFRRDDEWRYQEAAVQGSSFYDLPRLLHWASANIGFHHIHHLNPNVPNYRLPQIHVSHPEFQRAARLGLAASFGTASLALWSEEERQLLSFASALRRERSGPGPRARA